MPLSPDTVLVRRPYLRLSINSSNEVQVSADGGRPVNCALHALSLLELFSAPLSVAEAIRQLGARLGGQDRVAAIATLFRLHEGGVLRDVNEPDETAPAPGDVVDSVSPDEIYFECRLDDRARVGSLPRA